MSDLLDVRYADLESNSEPLICPSSNMLPQALGQRLARPVRLTILDLSP
jgi:hypothetical protein